MLTVGGSCLRLDLMLELHLEFLLLLFSRLGLNLAFDSALCQISWLVSCPFLARKRREILLSAVHYYLRSVPLMSQSKGVARIDLEPPMVHLTALYFHDFGHYFRPN